MEKQNQGIQSVEQAFDIIEFFANTHEPISLGEAAKKMDIAKSRLHKYLASLLRTGVVVQDSNGNYLNGSRLLELSSKIVGQTDLVKLCEPILHTLRFETQEAVALAVWSSKGPLFIRCLESPIPMAMQFRVGFYAPVTQSAAGRCFASYLPESAYSHLMEDEFVEYGGSAESFREELNEVRAQGYAERVTINATIPGSKAAAAPVFDSLGNIVASLVVLGFDKSDKIPDKDKALLKKLSTSLSAQLGYSSQI
ncbi:IclR family transcriptional regulator [Vibrio sp. 99-8-1]|uniref:IclR family transcriptional regulator n=1 Tax=Vibrio sp. 99-8-1 TaxID=2607602 RepID=UPI0014939FED|nr:IclR family transcriptional regulator [Vibrio sp. 99-8-1]NOI66451.1 IclR family transcriptional regulator [Vibrio sp. 99-8-1]